jgi:outer membrane protein insertion porin family
LNKAVNEIGLAVARIYDKSIVEKAEQELKRQYLAKGRYDAVITTTVTPIERNRVEIVVSAEEGEASKIQKITFVGNKAFSDKELTKAIELTTPGWFTWYNKSDQYSKQKLTSDLESIRSLYMNQGYIEMKIDSSQVSISPDKKNIYLTINIREGERYKVSSVNLYGEMFGREEELRKLLQLKAGDVYSAEKLEESTKAISDRLGNFGYAFANVNASPELDREKKEVALTVLVDPGKRVYVRHINIGGNTRTRDEVLRREFRQFEGSWYDNEKIKRSKERVDRLDYFKEVDIETPEVPGTTDQVDVNLSVTEKPTGVFSVGAGFSQAERFVLSGSIQEVNAFGSGNTIGIDVNTSKINRVIGLSQVNPYFTDDGISRGFELYSRVSRPPLISSNSYRTQSNGGNMRFGIPLSEFASMQIGVGVESTKVETFQTYRTNSIGQLIVDPITKQPIGVNLSPALYQRYVRQFAGNEALSAKTVAIPFTAAWVRDSRDSALTPNSGNYQRASIEVAPGTDLKYFRFSYQNQYFRPLWKYFTVALNGSFDYGRAFGGKPYPVFKNYYAGGIGSVRGFESSTLGPIDPLTLEPLGGTKRIIGNAELQITPPGSGKDNAFRGFLFFDGGNVFAENSRIRFGDLRYSAGIGVTWISPVGPMKISLGKPLNAKSGDRLERFQFQVGTGF